MMIYKEFPTLIVSYSSRPGEFGMCFQTFVQWTYSQPVGPFPSEVIACLSERSLVSSQRVFANALHKLGHLKDVELAILSRWEEWLSANVASNKIDIFIYVRTSPSVVLKRSQIRDRPEEINLSLTYLTLLHELLDDWLLSRGGNLRTPVFIVNGDLPANTVLKDVEECLKFCC